MVSPSLADDDEESSSKKSKRGILPKLATQVMKSWLFQHIVVSGGQFHRVFPTCEQHGGISSKVLENTGLFLCGFSTMFIFMMTLNHYNCVLLFF